MCGIAGIFGPHVEAGMLQPMLRAQRHRGPDDSGLFLAPSETAGFAQNRLSILDLSSAGHQPMSSRDGRLTIAFNGEIYNYLELRAELPNYAFRSGADTEVLLAAWERWGPACLDRLIGMFAFLLWDEQQRTAYAVRDRFGVKPLYYAQQGSMLLAASEVKALHAAGIPAAENQQAWATYLNSGSLDTTEETFWRDIRSLAPGHMMTWRDGHHAITRWYDLAEAAGPEYDSRPAVTVYEEYSALMVDSVRLRFRSDVPVGINLSGGLDSALLLASVRRMQGAGAEVTAYTFATNDPRYDELPWVNRMLASTQHRSSVAMLTPAEVPPLAQNVAEFQDEPFGGLPTLAYAKLFEQARCEGTIVLLDGQGMDEQWAGYDYYASSGTAGLVQGTATAPVRPECLTHTFRQCATNFRAPEPFPDRLRNLQYRDARYTKIPRALRFNDRVSMRRSTELREPFLDHRLFELALRQPPERKLSGSIQKAGLREIAKRMIPQGVAEAPKRPLQTPQREWLRGPLRPWVEEHIEAVIRERREWFDGAAVRRVWREYLDGLSDNSFYVWQWIGTSLTLGLRAGVAHV
ncbi:MAG TPA: asparagine synthase (glutamine-hydrolyzing) [Bryobacteraceae bacterium]|nr:asparagine synthase (glutamine-hydrolyzing) [Bryobacteraceae bacterium]